jgi:hypothetical protein
MQNFKYGLEKVKHHAINTYRGPETGLQLQAFLTSAVAARSGRIPSWENAASNQWTEG